MTFDETVKQILEKTLKFQAPVGAKDESEEDTGAGMANVLGTTLTPQDITIAKAMASQAKGGALFNRNPQKQIDQAYGDIMGKLAKKLKATAASIKV